MPVEVELMRHNRLIDPHLQIWGWEIPVYLFLGGLTAGLMILSALLAMGDKTEERSRWVRWMPFAAPILISLGMVALFLDLSHKWHVYRFYLIFRPSSPMSWGAWILVFIYPATLLLGLADLTRGEIDKLRSWGPLRVLRLGSLAAWLRDQVRPRIEGLRWTNLVLGVALGGYTGILLSSLGARALWNSSLLGPLFLVSGFSSGAAFLMLFAVNRTEHRRLRRFDLAALGLEAVLLGLFILGLLTGGGAAGREAASLILGGAYTAIFWALVVATGLVLPFLVEYLEDSRGLRPTRVAPVLVLAGGLALRWVPRFRRSGLKKRNETSPPSVSLYT